MRMGLSGLNGHRHKYGFIDNGHCPYCTCAKEDPIHFFLECPKYAAQRVTLFTKLAALTSPGVHYTATIPTNMNDKKLYTKMLLFGMDNLNAIELFTVVHEFIIASKRF